MEKRRMRRKTMLAIVFILVITAILSVLLYVGVGLATPTYFMDFATTQDVKIHILSKLHVGTSLKNVQNAMTTRLFGYVECDFSRISKDSSIGEMLLPCTALKRKGDLWFYSLVFYFHDDALTDVDVSEIYRGL